MALEAWYNKDFLPRLDKVAGSHTPLEGLMPADPVGGRLQADYIARNPNPVGEKDKLLAAPDGSRYDAAHAHYHRDAVQQLIQSRESELAAAIRADAEARLDQLKAQLTNQIAGRVTGQLNRSFSFYDDWFDPVIGLRGRFNLNKAIRPTRGQAAGVNLVKICTLRWYRP